jgi:hypothetical protein
VKRQERDSSILPLSAGRFSAGSETRMKAISSKRHRFPPDTNSIAGAVGGAMPSLPH